MPHAFVACGAANEALPQLAPGSARLANFSPPYLDLVDYAKAAAESNNLHAWRTSHTQPLPDYVEEMLSTCALLYEALADDAVATVEIDDVRVLGGGRLILLSDIWRQMLQTVGFRIAEVITLVRQIEIGHRSGSLVQYGTPGHYYPGNITSDLLVAFKGEPQERLRRDSTDADRIDIAWARSYLKNAWKVTVPRAIERKSRDGHPCPQDSEVVRAAIRFYSIRGDLVLDPFAGVGTTGIVALQEGRSAALVELQPANVAAIHRNLPAPSLPFGEVPERILMPGAQFYLPLDDLAQTRARRAFLSASRTGEITTRLRDMARLTSQMAGVEITPELLAVMLRAERDYYSQHDQ